MRAKMLLPGLSMLLLSMWSCADQIDPVYQFEDGFYLVEGRIANQDGYGKVSVSLSELIDGVYRLNRLEGARVSSVDNQGGTVEWEADAGTIDYYPPENFTGVPGRSYYIRVEAPGGRILESVPEMMPEPVPIADFRIGFEQEAYFDLVRDAFIPAFRLLIDADDPAGQDNFYQWSRRTFQLVDVCQSCFGQRYRNGECETHRSARFVDRWDYLCEGECWGVSNPLDFQLFSDQFSQGLPIRDLLVGFEDFDRPNGGLLIEVSQLQLSRENYEYNSLLKELTTESGGLNAVIPSALVGNMRELGSDDELTVLGYFGAVSVAAKRRFIDRATVNGVSLPFDRDIREEPAPDCVMDCPPLAPCSGPRWTSTEPEGWEE